MNRLTQQRTAHRYVIYLAIVLLTGCGGGGGDGGGGTNPPSPPPSNPVTFEAELTGITINDMATGNPVSTTGLPLRGAVITVAP